MGAEFHLYKFKGDISKYSKTKWGQVPSLAPTSLHTCVNPSILPIKVCERNLSSSVEDRRGGERGKKIIETQMDEEWWTKRKGKIKKKLRENRQHVGGGIKKAHEDFL